MKKKIISTRESVKSKSDKKNSTLAKRTKKSLHGKNIKSDVIAKQQYKKYLEDNLFQNVEIINNPVDIKAEKDGQIHYFEIKMTKQKKDYFGAATLTEWAQAFKTPSNFKFVIAKTDHAERNFKFTEFTPEEFMQHSTIPPFKIYFNVNLKGATKTRKRRTAIQLTEDTMNLLIALHDKIRPEQRR